MIQRGHSKFQNVLIPPEVFFLQLFSCEKYSFAAKNVKLIWNCSHHPPPPPPFPSPSRVHHGWSPRIIVLKIEPPEIAISSIVLRKLRECYRNTLERNIMELGRNAAFASLWLKIRLHSFFQNRPFVQLLQPRGYPVITVNNPRRALSFLERTTNEFAPNSTFAFPNEQFVFV